MPLIFVAAALPFSVSNATTSLRGFVSIHDSQVYFRPLVPTLAPRLHPSGSVQRELTIQTPLAIRAALLDLKSGDYVVVSGSLNDTNQDGKSDEITILAIESVGLKDILGAWRSDKWEVVRFEDFSRMSLYRPKYRTTLSADSAVDFRPGLAASNLVGDRPRLGPMTSLRRLGFTKFKDLNYTLAPESGTSYSIFLVEKTAGGGPAPVFVGRLDVKKRALTLEIYDPKTGGASEVLSLSPVRD